MWGSPERKRGTDKQGRISVGDRIGVLVELEGKEKGSVQFYLNGKQHGPGFSEGVTGPLVLGVQIMHRYQQMVLLPDAERPTPDQ